MKRRDFLKGGAAAGFYLAATRVYGQDVKRDEQKLRVLAVGTGGRGRAVMKGLHDSGKVVFTGLCDVDPTRLAEAREAYEGAPAETDFRKLLAAHADSYDAVSISTPDHTHALVALAAMRLGKHVYVEKPLAHSFAECEMLLASARAHKVVTQMGNTGHPGVYRYEKLWEAGFWGDVLAVHAWTDRAGGHWWAQGMRAAPNAATPPAGYNWDAWLGPAAVRPFSPAYVPFSWRGWRDFGCGAIGDMAVHNMDPAYWLLAEGKLPVRVCSWADDRYDLAFPKYSTIDFRFGPTAKCPKGFNLYWYESSILPKPPPGAHPAYAFGTNGLMIEGSRATTVGASHAAAPMCVAATGHAFGPEAKALQKAGNELFKVAQGTRARWQYNHFTEWVEACYANDPARCGSRFEYAVPLTETLLFGCIAQAMPGTELIWDPAKRAFNDPAATAMLKATDRPGFELRV